MRLAAALCPCLALLAGLATADVKTETISRVTLLSGIGTTEIRSATELQADKRLENQEMRMVGGIGGAFAGKPRATATVTRLDRELYWDIIHANKTYSERPLIAPAEPAGSREARGEAESQESSKSPYRIKKTDLKVNKTGQSRDINGFPCTEYVMTMEVVLEDTASKGTVTQLMTTDMWTTPLTDELKASQAAEADFSRRLAAKAGVTATPTEPDRLGAGMFTTMYGVDPQEAAAQMEKVSREMAKIEGYPVVTDLKWQVKDDSSQAREPEPEPEPSGGISGMLANRIAQKMAPKKSEQDVLFSSYYELRSVAVGTLPDADFEVPAGYKKVQK